MPLVGIIAPKRDVQEIRKEIKEYNINIIEIKKESIKNFRNVEFEEIIILENINVEENEYKYMNEILCNTQCIILNGDIEIDMLKNIELKKPTKLITFGFNSKSTISISSVNDEKIIVCIQRNIEKNNREIIECQEKKIVIKNIKKIYNNLVVFIIKELYNL